MANNIVLRNSGKVKLLSQDRETFLATLEWRLFVNNVAPNPTLTNSQFTECTDSGYSPQATPFSVPALNGSNEGQTVGDVITNVMTHSPGNYTIYGVFATDPANADEWVLAAATTPLAITAAGQVAQIAPVYKNDDLP